LEKRERKSTGGRRRGGRKWDSQGGGKQEKKEKTCNKYSAMEKTQSGGSQQILGGNWD